MLTMSQSCCREVEERWIIPDASVGSLSQFIELAAEIQASNAALIAAIRTCVTVPTRTLWVQPSASAVGIFLKTSEGLVERPADEVFGAWKPETSFVSLEDTFNDHLDCNIVLEGRHSKLAAFAARMAELERATAAAILEFGAQIGVAPSSPRPTAPTLPVPVTAPAAVPRILAPSAPGIYDADPTDAKASVFVSPFPSSTSLAPLAVSVALDPLGEFHAHFPKLREWVREATGAPVATEFLVYRATRDGFRKFDFHRMCDNKRRLLVIIQESSRRWLFGGYTTVGFGSKYMFVPDPQSRLFTLTNPHGIPPTVYKPAKPEAGVNNDTDCGAVFGTTYVELSICDACNVSAGTFVLLLCASCRCTYKPSPTVM
jgi:hypothetical protein